MLISMVDPSLIKASSWSTLGDTSLHRSAYIGKFDIVYLLLAAGVEYNKQNCAGETPLDEAVR
jgi:ankyrin repeat protein